MKAETLNKAIILLQIAHASNHQMAIQLMEAKLIENAKYYQLVAREQFMTIEMLRKQ